MATNTKCFSCGNLHNHRGLKMFGRQYIFAEKNLFFAKEASLTLKKQLLP